MLDADQRAPFRVQLPDTRSKSLYTSRVQPDCRLVA